MIQTLHKALLRRGVYAQGDKQVHKLVVRTDNGPQFDSRKFRAFCEETKRVEHEQIPTKTPNKNAYIESFHSIVERGCFQRNRFSSFEEAYAVVDRFIRYYNTQRIHGSLMDHSPTQYLQLVQQGIIQPQVIAL